MSSRPYLSGFLYFALGFLLMLGSKHVSFSFFGLTAEYISGFAIGLAAVAFIAATAVFARVLTRQLNRTR